MDKQWEVADSYGDVATIFFDAARKEVTVFQVIKRDSGNEETSMTYPAAQLDTLIAALTEARRAIS